MFIEQKVRDLMIPLERYSVVSLHSTLREATLSLRTAYCELEAGLCTEAGPRTILVMDDDQELVGILDFRSILKVLIPEVAGGLSGKLASLGVSVTFAEADTPALDEKGARFHARVLKNAEVRVEKIMLKIKGTIQADADLLDALRLVFRNKLTVIPVYEGKRLIGVVRDTELFLAVADILRD